MTKRKYISIILKSIFLLVLALFLMDIFSPLEIKSQTVKSCAYIGLLVFSPILLVWNIVFCKPRKRKLIESVLPILAIAGILIVGPVKILFASSSWKTQSIHYQNTQWAFNRIESQTQDVGALGYNKRTVEVIYLTDAFMIVNKVGQNVRSNKTWLKVEKDVIEMER